MSGLWRLFFTALNKLLAAATVVCALPAVAEDSTGFFLGATVTTPSTNHTIWSGASLTEAGTISAPLTAQTGGVDLVDDVQLRAGYNFGAALGFLTLEQGEIGDDATPELGIGLMIPLGRNLQVSGQISRSGLLHGAPETEARENTFSVNAAFQF